MYDDPNNSFDLENFIEFMDIVANISSRITEDWVTNLNDGTRHLPLHIFGQFQGTCLWTSLDNFTWFTLLTP